MQRQTPSAADASNGYSVEIHEISKEESNRGSNANQSQTRISSLQAPKETNKGKTHSRELVAAEQQVIVSCSHTSHARDMVFRNFLTADPRDSLRGLPSSLFDRKGVLQIVEEQFEGGFPVFLVVSKMREQEWDAWVFEVMSSIMGVILSRVGE